MSGLPIRTVYDGSDGLVATGYRQTWLGVPGFVLRIDTRIGPEYPNPPNPADIPVDIAPFDRSTTQGESDGVVNYVLHEPSGVVSVWAEGLSQADVEAVARSLVRRGDGLPGWDVQLPAAFPAESTFMREGAFGELSLHQLQWWDEQGPVAELMVATDSLFVSGTRSGPIEISLLDGQGTPAVVESMPGDGAQQRTVVTWAVGDGQVAQLRLVGTIDDAKRFLSGLREVEPAAWEAAGQVDTRVADGCGPSVMGC